MKKILIFLTCANKKEAGVISKALLERRLVVCIKKSPVTSSFLWRRKIKLSKEILLIMDSFHEKFEDIEKEVRKLHSYKTFVLIATPVIKASGGIEEWMREELK